MYVIRLATKTPREHGRGHAREPNGLEMPTGDFLARVFASMAPRETPREGLNGLAKKVPREHPRVPTPREVGREAL